jgi:nitroreductase
MIKIMEKRRTIREYKDAAVSANVMNHVRETIEKLPDLTEKAKVEIGLLQDGHGVYEALNGIVGYHGIMIKAPHYLIMMCEEREENFIATGYAGEWLSLELTKLDLGSCWLQTAAKSDLIKEKLGIQSSLTVASLIAFGEPKGSARLSRIYDASGDYSASALTKFGYPYIDASYKDESQSDRLSIQEIVYHKTFGNNMDLEDIERHGFAEVFFYMRFAPSWGNLQPWRFVLQSDRLILAMKKNDVLEPHTGLIDAGIAMLYLDSAMKSKGYSGEWTVGKVECAENAMIPEDHWVAGCYRF